MRRRVFAISIGFTLLSVLAAVGWTLFHERSADDLVARALEKLGAPLEQAPSLDRLQASSARSLLNRARELGRDDAVVNGWSAYARAIEDLQRGDLVLAEGELRTARRHLGRNAELEALAAVLARGRMEQGRAAEHARAALEIDPHNAHARLVAIDLALDREDGRAALDHLETLIPVAPRAGALYQRRGVAHELIGSMGDAESDYLEAVRLDPRRTEAWVNLGRLRRRDGRHEAALSAFERAVRSDRDDSQAYLGRGLSRAALGEIAGAREDFERSAALAPNDAEPLLALGDLSRDLGEYEGAARTYRQAIAREDADAASWLKLGNVLAILTRYEDAADAFDAALRRAPDLAAAHNGLGASLMHLGRTDAAIRALDRAASLDRRDANPLMNLALLHERRGDRDAAREAWERALERDPASEIAQRHLARLAG
jgi:tetratricopeptide (TPR) repeat protein